MKVLKRICAWLLGFVFFIAGMLKLMDPVGTGFIVEAYFKFFHLQFLSPVSRAFGTVLSFLEAIIGAGLLTGIWKRQFAVLSGAFTAFFTVITFILWLYKPEMDCGCFGEAIKLTHYQTLVKNIILCFFWSVAFLPFSEIPGFRKIKYVSFGIASVSIFLYCIFFQFNVPVMDFTSMREGNDIQDEESYLSFCNADGEYCDDLALEGTVMILSFYDTDKVDGEKKGEVDGYVKMLSSLGITPLVLVSGDCAAFSDGYDFAPDCYSCDRKTLMTLNRTNGGGTFIYDSQIVAKCSENYLPSKEDLLPVFNQAPIETLVDLSSDSRLRLQGFFLYVFAVMVLL